jgi:hypothetical protein
MADMLSKAQNGDTLYELKSGSKKSSPWSILPRSQRPAGSSPHSASDAQMTYASRVTRKPMSDDEIVKWSSLNRQKTLNLFSSIFNFPFLLKFDWAQVAQT